MNRTLLVWAGASAALATTITISTAGCAATAAKSNAAAAVLDGHRASLRAHRERDWAWFTRDTDDPFIVVSRGEIHRVTVDQQRERFRKYLTEAEFSRYEDLEQPIVRVSPDGQMAWVIARVVVAGDRAMDDGSRRSLDSTWAWATLYENRAGRWVRVANISTRMPTPDESESTVGSTLPVGSGLSSTAALPADARRIWREAQQAMGGVHAIEAVRKITAVAEVTTPNGQGRLSVESHADGRVVFDQLLSGGKPNRAVVTRTESGDMAHNDGVAKPLSPRMSAFVRGHEFHINTLAAGVRFEHGKARAPESFAGRLCDVIEFSDRFGKPVRMFVDRESKLPAGLVSIEPMSDDDAPITVTLADWKRFGTIRLFTALQVQHRGATFGYRYRDIRLE